MADNDTNTAYQPWPHQGDSFTIAASVTALLTTNLVALLPRLYMILRRWHPLWAVRTLSICAAHVAMLCQSALVIAACRKGWGTSIDSLPTSNLRSAGVLVFASNILCVLVHGLSRICIAATLVKTSQSSSSSSYSILLAYTVPVWTVGAILGIALNKLGGSSYSRPFFEDSEFSLWAPIYLTGLLIDLLIAACAGGMIFALQMPLRNKIFSVSVFSSGILANIPIAYALAYIHQHSSHIAHDPTLNSTPFIIANQAAIAVSLWSRALDVSRVLANDIGYASYGHGPKGSYSISWPASYGEWTKRSQSNRHTTRQSARQSVRQAEDEMSLRPQGRTEHISKVEGGRSTHDELAPDGIAVSTSITQSFR